MASAQELARARLAEQRAIEESVRRFAARAGRTLFAGEEADGDLAQIQHLLQEARQLGIVAGPEPEAPGYELGVWGRACLEEGPALSLSTLALLAEVCAGFALAIHAQGLACLALGQAHAGSGRAPFAPDIPLAAAFTPAYGIPLRAEGSGLLLQETDGRQQLNGTTHFLLAAEPPRTVLSFARAGDGMWQLVGLDTEAEGVRLEPVARRTGLRAAHQYHLSCDEVELVSEQIYLSDREAEAALQLVLGCDWLGQAAIATGVVRGALHDSRRYTATRYQGGRIIEEHATIRLLQGEAAYDLALLESLVAHHAHEPLLARGSQVLLRQALTARLAVVEHAHRAVTGCLQTLGGYGYMEDYGFEKRLRDVSALKSLHGAPDQLKLFLNDLCRDPLQA